MGEPPVRLRVLGPARLDRGEVGHPIRSRRQRRILVALAAADGRTVTADTLIDVAWAGQPVAHPQAALRTQLSRLRRLLDPADGALCAEPTGYRLALDRAAVDAWRFEDLLAAAGRANAPSAAAPSAAAPSAAAPSAAAPSAAALSEALALWDGDAYADADDHPVVRAAAARLEELRRRAVEDLALAHLDDGTPDRAAAVIAPLLVADPLRERARGIELRALYAVGRGSEALARYRAHRHRLAEELGTDPSPALQRLERDILAQELDSESLGPDPVAVLPPRPVSSFVGRDDELRGLIGLLRRVRMVTVLGPAGVGKTRLALHACHAVRRRYDDGAWWCDLAAISPGEVATAVATRLGLAERAGEPLPRRVASFLGHWRALLVLDNCEHVAAEVAALVGAVLQDGAGVDVLATSRGPLGVDGEHRLRLAPLPLPVGTEPSAAVELFLDRARAVAPGFDPRGDDRAATVELCRRLGGLPLALELAAACMTRIDVRALGDRVGHHLGLLDRADQRPTDRHHSLLTVLESSYHLLSADERALLERLSVFAGPFTLDAAEALAHEGAGGPLGALVDNSMVLFRPDRRYELLPTVRAFASDELARTGKRQVYRRRHAEVVVRLAEHTDTRLRTPDARLVHTVLDDALAELRAARAWLLAAAEIGPLIDLSASTHWFAMLRTRMELNRWAEHLIDEHADRAAGHPRLEQVRACAAMGATKRGDLARARALAEAGPPGADGRFCLEILAQVALFEGRLAEAANHARHAAARHHDAGDEAWAVNASSVEAVALAYGGQPGAAADLARSLVRAADTLGVPSQQAMMRYILAEATPEPSTAMAGYERAITLAREVDAEFVVGVATTSLAARELRTGQHDRARRRLGDAIAHWQRAGVRTQGWLAIRLLIEALHRESQHESVAVLAGAHAASPHAAPAYGDDATRLTEAAGSARDRLGDAHTSRRGGAAPSSPTTRPPHTRASSPPSQADPSHPWQDRPRATRGDRHVRGTGPLRPRRSADRPRRGHRGWAAAWCTVTAAEDSAPDERPVALVTGASTGLGRATALLLARRGYRVFGTSRRPDRHVDGVDFVPLDVTDPHSIIGCVATVLGRSGRIDLLVNNAGAMYEGFAEETDIADARRLFDTNLFGPAQLIDAVLPTMRERRTGRIVNIGSLAAWVGEPGEAYYAASKAALARYTEALRHEVGHLGIAVSVIEPGAFVTGVLDAAPIAERSVPDYDGLRERARQVVQDGLRRGGNPETVAQLVLAVAQSRHPRFRYGCGTGGRWLPLLRSLLPSRALDQLLRHSFGFPTRLPRRRG